MERLQLELGGSEEAVGSALLGATDAAPESATEAAASLSELPIDAPEQGAQSQTYTTAAPAKAEPQPEPEPEPEQSAAAAGGGADAGSEPDLHDLLGDLMGALRKDPASVLENAGA